MPVSLTVAQFIADARIGATAAELDVATRRLAYAEAAIRQYLGKSYATAPDVVLNEAASRLAAYQYDSPTVSGGAGFANALRNSGTTAILLPYRIHGLGQTDAIAEAQAAVGSIGNPVVGVSYSGDTLLISYADGQTETFTIVAGGGGGGVLNVDDGRLPFAPVAMRIAWLETPTTPVDADTFAPPATVGTTAQTLVPDFPQDFLDLNLRQANLAIWAATDLELVAVTGNYITEAMGTALQVDGVDGSYWVTTSLIGRYDGGNPVTLVFPGTLIATQPWVIEQIGDTGGGMFNGVDQFARDGVITAQAAAEAAQTDATAAQTDATDAATAAAAASAEASTAQGTADTNTTAVATAQTAADDAQDNLNDHETDHPRSTRVFIQTSFPSNFGNQLDDVWIRDTVGVPWTLWKWNGTAWAITYTSEAGGSVVTASAVAPAPGTQIAAQFDIDGDTWALPAPTAGGNTYALLGTANLSANQYVLTTFPGNAVAAALIDGTGGYHSLMVALRDFSRHYNLWTIPIDFRTFGDDTMHEFYAAYINNSTGAVSGMNLSIERDTGQNATVALVMLTAATFDAGTQLSLYGVS